MLQLLDIPPLSTHRKYLKLINMYNIFANHSYPISLYDMLFLIVFTVMQILLDLLPVYIFIHCTKCSYQIEHCLIVLSNCHLFQHLNDPYNVISFG